MRDHGRNAKTVNKGLTLVEMLIVLTIMSILFAIIIPAYEHQVMKTRRSEGHNLLQKIQMHMERYRFDYRIYPENLSQIKGYSNDEQMSESGFYLVSIDSGSSSCGIQPCYILRARPQEGQEKDGDLELHSNGTRVGHW